MLGDKKEKSVRRHDFMKRYRQFCAERDCHFHDKRRRIGIKRGIVWLKLAGRIPASWEDRHGSV